MWGECGRLLCAALVVPALGCRVLGAAFQARLTDAVTPSVPTLASMRARRLLKYVMHMLVVECCAIQKINRSNYGLLEVRRTNSFY